MKIFTILILSSFSALRCGAAVYQSNGSEASVRACINLANEADIITLPAGTFTWTQPMDVTKGITIQRQTTITGAGTANPVINDLTIIKDDTLPRGIAN